MNTWQQLLRDNDPAAAPGDARLEACDADAIRRAAIAAAREPRPAPLRWQQPLAMAALIVLMIGTGVVAGRRAAVRDTSTGPAVTMPVGSPQQQQLQFSTPGGTRIIWVFNSEFDLKETIP
jgi:hypothetical protein